MINLIWAMDINWLIGKDNKLPWRYPEDLQYFKKMTHHKTVLMGDNTYDSLKGYYQDKALPFKKIYVATVTDRTFEGCEVVKDIAQFLKSYQEELWVVGGKTIYQLSLPYADKLYITWILKPYQGNIYFPEFNLVNDYLKLSETEGTNEDLKFVVYGKKA
ncbi:MAG: dihydrofolate reductase [Acholeplasmataceae bacterium]|jgi:dihydrofolate reductase|nr:dihydrofolate reductase [Acholeplasmataceae bacterium]MDY0316920.1 dihydrofolate reductase [Acholeplasmatales bacterium]MDD2259612.1 dihydrofolate reductase [Acholeplasmataceae bacterium]MDD4203518.1 dihydrofolate reductase [Acholeplasmataceae bacterium]MDD4468661.1 dihydrofolate reductase [Acholeplasmataceae bacterium]